MKIWFYWADGIETMPSVPALCLKSLQKNCGTHEIVPISDGNLAKYADESFLKEFKHNKIISVQSFSDLLRLHLLNKHGGLWVDATCLINIDIDTIVNEIHDNFFAVNNPGPDRPISTWFIYSTKNNPIMSRWESSARKFWKRKFKGRNDAPFLFTQGRPGTKYKTLAQLSINPIYLTITRKYPYFWVHYIFERDLAKTYFSKVSKESVKNYQAIECHKIQNIGLLTESDENTISSILEQNPIQKLNWHVDGNAIDITNAKPNSTLTLLWNKACLTSPSFPH